MKLNESLRRVRTQNKITQTQAAQAAGVSPAMYQFYEYGRNEPTASVLVALGVLGRPLAPVLLKTGGDTECFQIV